MNKTQKNGLLAAVVVAASVVALPASAALDAAITTAVADSIAQILLVIALGGAGYITISGAGVIWNVASKFIKRLGGKA